MNFVKSLCILVFFIGTCANQMFVATHVWSHAHPDSASAPRVKASPHVLTKSHHHDDAHRHPENHTKIQIGNDSQSDAETHHHHSHFSLSFDNCMPANAKLKQYKLAFYSPVYCLSRDHLEADKGKRHDSPVLYRFAHERIDPTVLRLHTTSILI